MGKASNPPPRTAGGRFGSGPSGDKEIGDDVLRAQHLRIIKEAAARGEPQAELEWGLYLIDGVLDESGRVLLKAEPRNGIAWLRRAAKHGVAGAQLNLGYYLDIGKYVRRSPREAMQWYQRAYRHGSAAAASNIATVYRSRGLERRAYWWFRRAAEMGDGDSFVEVGTRLCHGRGVACDPREGVRWLRKAIRSQEITEAGREEAMFQLGKAYIEGLGVRKSKRDADAWLRKAASDGHAGAVELTSP